MGIFQGLRFCIDLDGAGAGKTALEQQLTALIGAGAGEIVHDIADATHAVLRHRQQPTCQAAVDISTVSVVPPEWVIHSATQQQLQVEHGCIWPGPAIPGMSEHVQEVTVSGITGIDRAITRYKVECTGCLYSPNMSLAITTHVISTQDAFQQRSNKITAAIERGITIVSAAWLDQCLEEWRHVPEGPYNLTADTRAELQETPQSCSEQPQEQQQQQPQLQQPQQPGEQRRLLQAGPHIPQGPGLPQMPADRPAPSTLEDLCSLQPPGAHLSQAPGGAQARVTVGGAGAAHAVEVASGAAEQVAATATDAGVDGAALEDDAAAAADGGSAGVDAAGGAGVGAGILDDDAMSQDVTADPTQEQDDVDAADAGQPEVASHIPSPPQHSAGAPAQAAGVAAHEDAPPDFEGLAPATARPTSTEPLASTAPLVDLDADLTQPGDDELDVTSQVAPGQQQEPQGQQQEQEPQGQQQEQQQEQSMGAAGRGKNDFAIPGGDGGSTPAAAPAGPEADEPELEAAADMPGADLAAAPAATGVEPMDMDVPAEGVPMQQDLPHAAATDRDDVDAGNDDSDDGQEQQQQQQEHSEPDPVGAPAAQHGLLGAAVGVEGGKGPTSVQSLAFRMGTLAANTQALAGAEHFVDQLVGDLHFSTDEDSSGPLLAAPARRPSRLQPQEHTLLQRWDTAGSSRQDAAGASGAASGAGASTRRSTLGSNFKVAGLSRRRTSAATPASAAGAGSRGTSPPLPAAVAATGGSMPQLDAAPDSPTAAAQAGGVTTALSGGHNRRRAASASPRLAQRQLPAAAALGAVGTEQAPGLEAAADQDDAAAAAPAAAASGGSGDRGHSPSDDTAMAAQLLNGGSRHTSAAGGRRHQQQRPEAAGTGPADKATPRIVTARRQRIQQREADGGQHDEPQQPKKTGRQGQQQQQRQKQQQKQQQQQQQVDGAEQQHSIAADAASPVGAEPAESPADEATLGAAGDREQVDKQQGDAAVQDTAGGKDAPAAKKRGRRGSGAAGTTRKAGAAAGPSGTTPAPRGRSRTHVTQAGDEVAAAVQAGKQQEPVGPAATAARSRKRARPMASAQAASPAADGLYEGAAAAADGAGEAAEPDSASRGVPAGSTGKRAAGGKAASKAAAAGAAGKRAAGTRKTQQELLEPPSDGEEGQEQLVQQRQAPAPSTSARRGKGSAKPRQQQQQQQEPAPAPKRGRKRDTPQDEQHAAAAEAEQVSADDGAVLQPGSKRRKRGSTARQPQVDERASPEAVPGQDDGSGDSQPHGAEDGDEGPDREQLEQQHTARTKTKAGKKYDQPVKAAAATRRKGPARAKQAASPAAAAAAELPSPAAAVPAAAAATPVVALSGMHGDERARHAATLRRLRVRCLPGSHDWQPDTTHVVQPDLKRSEKSLAGMAAGAWLVKQQWLVDSGTAGRLLDPAPYELEACDTPAGSISEGAPMHWRLCRQALAAAAGDAAAAHDTAGSFGAFFGLRVVFYGTFDTPSRASLSRMLEAGGGQVLSKAPPYTRVLPAAAGGNQAAAGKAGRRGRSSAAAGESATPGSQGAWRCNLAVIAANKNNVDSVVSSFLAAGVTCVSPTYLVDWLAHPWLSLEQHYLFGSQPDQGGELQQLEAARASEGQGQQQSMSF